MSDNHHKKCEADGCETRANFNVKGASCASISTVRQRQKRPMRESLLRNPFENPFPLRAFLCMGMYVCICLVWDVHQYGLHSWMLMQETQRQGFVLSISCRVWPISALQSSTKPLLKVRPLIDRAGQPTYGLVTSIRNFTRTLRPWHSCLLYASAAGVLADFRLSCILLWCSDDERQLCRFIWKRSQLRLGRVHAHYSRSTWSCNPKPFRCATLCTRKSQRALGGSLWSSCL